MNFKILQMQVECLEADLKKLSLNLNEKENENRGLLGNVKKAVQKDGSVIKLLNRKTAIFSILQQWPPHYNFSIIHFISIIVFILERRSFLWVYRN